MTNSVGTKVALTAMIATIHHMRLAGDLSMTDLHREDCLRWQGQALGKQHLLRWDSQGKQFGGEDYPGFLALTAGTTAGAKIPPGGIGVAKMAIPERSFVE
jgi:hypothetical protein